MMEMPFHSLAGVPVGINRGPISGVSVGGFNVFVGFIVAIGNGVVVEVGVVVLVGKVFGAGIRAEQDVIHRDVSINSKEILNMQILLMKFRWQ